MLPGEHNRRNCCAIWDGALVSILGLGSRIPCGSCASVGTRLGCAWRRTRAAARVLGTPFLDWSFGHRPQGPALPLASCTDWVNGLCSRFRGGVSLAPRAMGKSDSCHRFCFFSGRRFFVSFREPGLGARTLAVKLLGLGQGRPVSGRNWSTCTQSTELRMWQLFLPASRRPALGGERIRSLRHHVSPAVGTRYDKLCNCLAQGHGDLCHWLP